MFFRALPLATVDLVTEGEPAFRWTDFLAEKRMSTQQAGKALDSYF